MKIGNYAMKNMAKQREKNRKATAIVSQLKWEKESGEVNARTLEELFTLFDLDREEIDYDVNIANQIEDSTIEDFSSFYLNYDMLQEGLHRANRKFLKSQKKLLKAICFSECEMPEEEKYMPLAYI